MEEVPLGTDEDEAQSSEDVGPEAKVPTQAEGGQDSGQPVTEGAESAEDLSATSWEDYFDSDRFAGDREYPGGAQD